MGWGVCVCVVGGGEIFCLFDPPPSSLSTGVFLKYSSTAEPSGRIPSPPTPPLRVSFKYSSTKELSFLRLKGDPRRMRERSKKKGGGEFFWVREPLSPLPLPRVSFKSPATGFRCGRILKEDPGEEAGGRRVKKTKYPPSPHHTHTHHPSSWSVL